MPELSQLVRQRLASRGAAGDHPDADILTAYSERLLPAAEHARVLEHIAGCAHCRDVVSLSLPDVVPTLPVPTPLPARRAWRWRPALGLAASLAMLGVVATVIVELPRKPETFQSAKQTPANPAQQDSLKAVPQPEQPSSLSASATTSATAPVRESRAVEPRSAPPAATYTVNGAIAGNAAVARSQVLASPPPPVAAQVPMRAEAIASASSNPAVADARLHERDYVNSQMFLAGQSGNDVTANPAAVPAAPMPSLAQTQASAPLSTTTPLAFADLPPQIENGKVLRSRQFSNPPSSHFGFPTLPALRKAEQKVEALAKRTVAIPPGALSFSAMENKSLNPSREDQVQNIGGQNASDKAGADLDRSNAFSQRALAAGSGGARYQAGAASAWRINEGKLLKSGGAGLWVEGYSGESIEFTVVTAHGSAVWAGGMNAALVHSVNGGASWERIALGASAAGYINSIDAAGANVHVTSSSGQAWSSDDGGKTWSLDK